MISGVIFDKDGTLFDFRRTWGGWAAMLLAELGGGDRGRVRALGQAIGYDTGAGEFHPDSPVIAGTPDEVAGCLLPLLPEWEAMALIDRMNHLAARAPLAEAAPLIPLMGGLRASGLRLAVATNDAEAPARAHLAAAGIAGLFDFVAGFDSGHGAKPAPGQLLAFAAEVRIAPDRIVMVGDSLHDLHAGRAAGMRTVAVLTGIATAADLSPHADAVLPDISALPGWIAAHAA